VLPPTMTLPVAVTFVDAKLVVVAFVIVAFVEVRLRMLATLAKKLVSTFSQEIVDVEIVVVARVAVPFMYVKPESVVVP
jgi:hypothetical protein